MTWPARSPGPTTRRGYPWGGWAISDFGGSGPVMQTKEDLWTR